MKPSEVEDVFPAEGTGALPALQLSEASTKCVMR